ncbi:MAG: hypothetical protein E3J35_03905 [Methanomassiliicoccales archaeon]|nr:MAG: hypothetical protein E3J35_03905 [Methanomassiliicoccales archaeon]
MIIDDLIVLGRACPDRIHNGRETVCAAGYSEKHGFVRIYPTKSDSPMKRWNIVKVSVERNRMDTREESWKIEGSRSEWYKLSEKIEVVGELKPKQRLNFVTGLVDGCVRQINAQKRSLGIVKPRIEKYYFGKRKHPQKGEQLDLWGRKLRKTKKDYILQPRITYKCVGPCDSSHNQQLLEWGVYEWMRKNPGKEDQVWKNLQLFSDKHQIYFFVGNQVLRRNAFRVISVLPLKRRSVSSPLFPFKKFIRRE